MSKQIRFEVSVTDGNRLVFGDFAHASMIFKLSEDFYLDEKITDEGMLEYLKDCIDTALKQIREDKDE